MKSGKGSTRPVQGGVAELAAAVLRIAAKPATASAVSLYVPAARENAAAAAVLRRQFFFSAGVHEGAEHVRALTAAVRAERRALVLGARKGGVFKDLEGFFRICGSG